MLDIRSKTLEKIRLDTSVLDINKCVVDEPKVSGLLRKGKGKWGIRIFSSISLLYCLTMGRFSVGFLLSFMISISAVAVGSLDRKVQDLEKQLNISIIIGEKVSSSWKAISYEIPTDTGVIFQYLNLLEKEFLKYPKSYFNRISLKRIALGNNLQINGQMRAAIPDPYGGTLFLGIDKPDRLRYPHYQTHVMHHELHHYAEYSYWRSMAYTWEDWTATNDTTFRYTGSGATAYQNLAVNWYQLSRPYKGFVNLYGTTAEEEDRAELVALIMGDEERKILEKMLREDHVLQQKILLIKFLLTEISGAKEGYWNAVLN